MGEGFQPFETKTQFKILFVLKFLQFPALLCNFKRRYVQVYSVALPVIYDVSKTLGYEFGKLQLPLINLWAFYVIKSCSGNCPWSRATREKTRKCVNNSGLEMTLSLERLLSA